uniref:Uncharacterized protein n=1 Tax=Setaria italica TaxID=4555 RepID=K3ZB55_SETIT
MSCRGPANRPRAKWPYIVKVHVCCVHRFFMIYHSCVCLVCSQLGDVLGTWGLQVCQIRTRKKSFGVLENRAERKGWAVADGNCGAAGNRYMQSYNMP